MQQYIQFWWVIPILLALVFYKFVLRVFFGMVMIPEDKVGLVTKKFVLFGGNKTLPNGKIVALNGESGFQADALAPGLYWFYWIWQYNVDMQAFIEIPKGKIGLVNAKDGLELPTGRILATKVECDNFQDARSFMTHGGQRGKQSFYLNTGVYRINTLLFDVNITDVTNIADGKVGVITALDGKPLDPGSIAGREVTGHNNFQDIDAFLSAGGQRGLQIQVIQAGSYTLNPWAVQVEVVAMTEIPIGHVGVVISFVGDDGEDTTGEAFKHGNIVKKGQKGVCASAMDPGKYPVNPYVMKVELVPTTNLVLNWANARSESHNLDENLSTITVRSKDGFPFNLDVSQIIHIPSTEAPKVIARFGSMLNLVSQVLEPTIGNYFRNSAQDSDVISFLTSRKERQESAKGHIKKVLDEYNVHAVDTLIGDITPPESLMLTLTDRKIAQEQKITFETQRSAQETRKDLESAKSLADIQGKMVAAQQGVEIAEKEAAAVVKKTEGEAKSIELRAVANAKSTEVNAAAEAKKITVTGTAEASAILQKGQATAKAYEEQVAAMGANNFAKFKITEEISRGRIKIIPDVLMAGNDSGPNGPIAGLLGLELMKKIGEDNEDRAEAIAEGKAVDKGNKDNKEKK